MDVRKDDVLWEKKIESHMGEGCDDGYLWECVQSDSDASESVGRAEAPNDGWLNANAKNTWQSTTARCTTSYLEHKGLPDRV